MRRMVKKKARRAGARPTTARASAMPQERRDEAARPPDSSGAGTSAPATSAARTPAPAESASAASAAPPSGSSPARPNVAWLLGAVAAVIAVVALARNLQRGGDASGEHATGEDRGDREIPISAAPDPPAPPERLAVRVVRSYPHDPHAFTQGLLWHQGHLFESTGLYRRSSLREVDLETGRVLRRREVEPRIFAEGLALVGDELVQLSWQENVAQVYSLEGFEPLRRHEYEGEGWGLCHDGAHLVMSDGSARLFFRDPATFRVVRSVEVTEEGEPIDQLNELECVGGAVWANVWQTDRILRIDPASGRVTGVAVVRDLLTEDELLDADVLNGIAWIPERERFVITGKLWPRAFEVEFVPAP